MSSQKGGTNYDFLAKGQSFITKLWPFAFTANGPLT
jgi:hypothetical protein